MVQNTDLFDAPYLPHFLPFQQSRSLNDINSPAHTAVLISLLITEAERNMNSCRGYFTASFF